ncbi:hypothetical protein P3T21_004532 [Paraburkholderia sp. GAS334]
MTTIKLQVKTKLNNPQFFKIGGDTQIQRLGFGAMRITGLASGVCRLIAQKQFACCAVFPN